MNISYSFGMIDLLHYGHIKALKLAKENADISVFGVVSDEAADAWFGEHVSNIEERKAVLSGIKYVDRVIEQRTFDPIDNLRALHQEFPDAVITLYHGNDWKVIPAQNYLETIGGRVVTFDYYEKLSPTRIVEVLNREPVHSKDINNLISTKANTLLALQNRLKLSRIEKIAVFTVGAFRTNSQMVTRFLSDNFGESKIVIRSSSKREDAFEASNAGHFDSVLGIDASDEDAVKNAFQTVIDSYVDGSVQPDDDEQVLVQKQTLDVAASGVVFTRDIQRNRPYYVINFDEGGSTDSVTSGAGGGKIAWLQHDATEKCIPSKWHELINAVREIEQVLGNMLLDIEFAITQTGDIVIFQVRPLAAGYKFGKGLETQKISCVHNEAIKKYTELRDNGLTLFSDMAFWNPAEIIGDSPKYLDYSLYEYIITHRAWSVGLAPMGYKLISDDLMYRFGNKPYISVEYSFSALTPEKVDAKLQNKLNNFYKKKLLADLSAHDKIEFEIVLNCYDFSTERKLDELRNCNFSEQELNELRESLQEITIHTIKNYRETLENDKTDLKILNRELEKALSMVMDDDGYGVLSNAIHILLDAIVDYGTPQFSRQARCAFIAKSLCVTLLNEGYISKEIYDGFMASIETVATEFERDFQNFQRGKIHREEFVEKYGHLRAGTYDIRSKRYDQMDFFTKELNVERSEEKPLSEEKREHLLPKEVIETALQEHGLEAIKYDALVYFLKTAIEQREYFKFEFTKSLSAVIEMIKKMGEKVGISVNDMSYLEVPEILSAENYSSAKGLYAMWTSLIESRKRQYKANNELILPSVITDVTGFDYIENMETRPNFVTEKKVSAKVVELDEIENGEIDNKIIILEKADPGYDWIFARKIAGLVTKYGGAASHMAIRCAEFEIPAAIGCGDRIFDYVKNADEIILDCKHEKIVRVVR